MSLVSQSDSEPVLGVYPEGEDDAGPIVEIAAGGTSDEVTITIDSYAPTVTLNLVVNGVIKPVAIDQR